MIDEQTATIAFLSDPATYGLRSGVERVETHCSIVFLAADRAYKLKRAIRYASLDYTTRKLRQAACQAELALNRRTAPHIYLEVRSINRAQDGTLAFDGPGPAIDHVVVMRRFARSELFDRMVEEDRLTPELMHQLGETVARFHMNADIRRADGGSAAIRRVIATNDAELAKVAPDLDGARVELLSRACWQAADDLLPLLDHRRSAGKVRRCHGDLRLANICLFDGQPTLFDCIEFSDEVSCVDVLYDLAFLLMDLALHDRADLGNTVFNAYLDVTGDTDGLRALPLFLALRAATRSYGLAGAARRRTDPAEAARLFGLARRHIEAGLEFLGPPDPLLILLDLEERGQERKVPEALAALAPPCPGARLLTLEPWDRQEWTDAARVLSAGCSVLIAGRVTSDVERRACDLVANLQVGIIAVSMRTGGHADDRFWRHAAIAEDARTILAEAVAAIRPESAAAVSGALDLDQCGAGLDGVHFPAASSS